MEGMAPAVALPFRVGNSLCENSMEITRLKLMTDTASLMAADPNHTVEEAGAVVVIAMEEGGEGDDFEVRTLPGSDDDEVLSVGPEPETELSAGSSGSIASDGSSNIGSVPEELVLDAVCEIVAPGSLDVVQGIGDVEDIIAHQSAVVKMVTVATGGSSSTLELGIQGSQICGTGCRSVFLMDCVPLWGIISICGRRPEMEDAVVAVPRFFEIPIRMLTADLSEEVFNPLTAHFFGVYDGHGGAQVANYCRERIHLALVEELRNVITGSGGTAGSDWQKKWEKAFVNCFLKVDDEIGGKVSRCIVEMAADTYEEGSSLSSGGTSEPVAPETVGSTAVVAVICSSHIIISNCGDSRAVLCRGKLPVPLSVDHKPNREDEYARIEAEGGKGHSVEWLQSIWSPRNVKVNWGSVPETLDHS
ncbi:Protein phosphatase 2C family protein [Dioscorea alata]|uniref:Protein phosphatase 2C family protein n=3 Tax=Dioscorea alata TaxID=55571 RepID=A0ACB7TVB4_DIOAL|nr:Protein phosphatase 2C family protein [Dioscorea alata]KAH7651937.1 Protein phosphatase 2C family protein [Dioscorea alata]KAH7651938.1 Protein phosphatase 2C family protein [Dioscorea alata]